MAADHLHHDKTSRHQWAEEVVVPKLADPIEGGSEPSAERWTRATSENRYLVDYLRTLEGRSEHPMETEKSRISENPYLVDCQMTNSQFHQGCRVPLAQTQQGP